MWFFFIVIVFLILGIIAEPYWVTGNVIDICDGSKNQIYVAVGASSFVSTVRTNTNFTQCHIQVISCPACILVIKIRFTELVTKCEEDENGVDVGGFTHCMCDRIEITEPLHKTYLRKQFCALNYDTASTNVTNPSFTYRSQTRSLNILFTYSQEYEYPFTIQLLAKYNIQHIDMSPDPNHPDVIGGIISTPFFPMQYPSDFRKQYNIRCLPLIPVHCRIKLVFTDHLLSSPTLIELFESNRRRIGITTEHIFRPPTVLSESSTLSLNFYANKASNFGFKAHYSAILENTAQSSLITKTAFTKPNSLIIACGGLINDGGGAITMINMAHNGSVVAYDCIWIIRPIQRLMDFKTHLFLKVIEYKDLDEAELEIHKGPTSSHRLLKLILSNSTSEKYQEYTANINTGFYISLRGEFRAVSRLIISYAAFSFSHSHDLGIVFSNSWESFDCYVNTDFLCHNHRCIHGYLRCDGVDHCGDFSDELQCILDGENTKNWRLYSPNYYFPSIETYSAIPVGLVISFCSSFVTFFTCCLVCTVVVCTKHQNDLNRRIRVLRHATSEPRTEERYTTDYGLVEEQPPEYDFPPTYHDIVLNDTLKKIDQHSKNLHNLASQANVNGNDSASCSRNLSAPNVTSNVQQELVCTTSFTSEDDSDSEAFECVQSTICEGLNTELKSSAGYIPFAQHAIEVVSNSDDCIFHHF